MGGSPKQPKETTQVVKQDSIPEYLAPSEKLNAEAACQFQSLDEEIYLVIAYENKEFIESFDLQPSLSDYHNRVVQQGFLEEINDALIDTTIIDTLGQYKQLITTVRGTINTYPIVYELRIIETGTAYYQVVLWARKDKFSKHQQDIKRMLASFKEL